MKVVRLTPEYNLDEFDCGDTDLNNFLVEDAKSFLDKRISLQSKATASIMTTGISILWL